MLVGPNATGKSNFLDGLQFIRDALDSRLDYALRTRGGLDVVRRKSGGHPTHLTLRIDLTSSLSPCGSRNRRSHMRRLLEMVTILGACSGSTPPIE